MDLFCSKKRWLIPEYDPIAVRSLCNELKLSPITASILVGRGITNSSDARWFLNSEDLYLYDPYLLKDMDKAVARIRTAMEKGERICVYGDYDVDGITATAVMYKYFSGKGCDVTYYIPKRLTEGYGMNMQAVDSLHDLGVKLIVTVDNGITANAEIEYAKKLGIDVVVTDHHECRAEIPECCAVVNPKRPDDTYPFESLAGVGVAFKTVCALEGENADDDFINSYVDLASLGTVADVMPLVDENRQIVARGLDCIGKGSNSGLNALIDTALCEKSKGHEKKITSSTVGFLIAPRLNAAGRIGNVESAVNLLIGEDYKSSLGIASELCAKNKERQSVENRIFTEAVEIIESEHDFANDKVIVACGDDWHHGVVGIVSSRITEKYGLPSVLICRENELGKGSGRSIKGFNINEAIHTCNDILVRHGGHELAAGLTLELDKVCEFKKRINDFARDRITEEMIEGCVEADAELSGEDVSLTVCEELLTLEPFGTQNPVPVLYMRDVTVKDVIALGQNKHTKLILEKDGRVFDGLLFGFPGESFRVPTSGLIDVLFNLDINEFRGERTPQLIIRDIRLCAADVKRCEGIAEMKSEIMNGRCPDAVPSIDVCRTVYKLLRIRDEKVSGLVNLFVLADEMSEGAGIKLPASVLGVILEIFAELGLVRLKKTDELIMKIELVKDCGKVDIESSNVLKKARNINSHP